jgi:GxxExxY protein
MTNGAALVGHQERKVRWDAGDAWDQSDWTCRGRNDSMISIRAQRELMARGHSVGREVYAPVHYKGELLVRQRLDMVVDEMLIVEVKSTYELHRAATRQVLNYLRATNMDLGLLLHFGPEPKVYRVSRSKPSSSSSGRDNPKYPTNPNEPSVLDASPTGSEQA